MFSAVGLWCSSSSVSQNAFTGSQAQQESCAKTNDIESKHVRKFCDGKIVISYKLFHQTITNALATHKSKTSHCFIPPIATLISEYSAEDELTPIPSIPCTLERQFVSSIGFGKKMWDHFGDIGHPPPLPSNICNILASPCPFFPNKTVQESHILALVPGTLNGQAMTLKRLAEQLIGLGSCFNPSNSFFSNYAETPFEASHWILMTNNVATETLDKSYEEQKRRVSGFNYQVPKLAQAATAIFMEYVATKKYHFSQYLTRCQEEELPGQMVIGWYGMKGLCIFDSDNYEKLGAAAVRTLSGSSG